MVKPTKTIMINLNTLNGSEMQLKSVRRTRIELQLIKRIGKELYDSTGDSIWVFDNILIAYNSICDLIALMGLDLKGEPNYSKILVLDGDMILRSEAMGESQIYKMMRLIASKDNWRSDTTRFDYYVIWVTLP